MRILKKFFENKNYSKLYIKRWIKFQSSLIGFKPKFEHIKGKDNILADWLNRQIIINNVDNANDWFYSTGTWLKENPLKLEPFNLKSYVWIKC